MMWSRGLRVPLRRKAGTPLVEAHGVCAQLGGRSILRDIDFVAYAGEVVALVGPNGAGKSTLLNVLAGDVGLSGGGITIDGAPLSAWSHGELALRRAVLPQHAAIAFPFLVDQVVRMGRSPWRHTPERAFDDVVVAEALEQTDVGHLAARQFPSLSGGERARVALARVLAQRTQLLMLDEPTASLDVRHQELVLRVARQRAAQGDGAIIVLHDLGLAATYADRVAVMSDGEVVAAGAPGETLTPTLLSGVYRHDIEVIPHPRTGAPLVIPVRGPSGCPGIA